MLKKFILFVCFSGAFFVLNAQSTDPVNGADNNNPYSNRAEIENNTSDNLPSLQKSEEESSVWGSFVRNVKAFAKTTKNFTSKEFYGGVLIYKPE